MRSVHVFFAAVAAAGMMFGASAGDAVPRDMKLFLCAGQSNMAGRGSLAELTDAEKAPVKNVWFLDAKGAWQPAVAPMHAEDFGGRQEKFGECVSLAFFFAREYAKAHPDEVVGMVPCAVGGTSISHWTGPSKNHPDGMDCYAYAAKRIEIAKANGTFVGILWHQGESDSATKGPRENGRRTWKVKYDAKKYRSSFVKVMEAFRKVCGDTTGYLPVVVAGELGPFTGGAAEYNAALGDVVKSVHNSTFASSAGTTGQRDELHFTTEDCRTMGRRYFEAYERQSDPKVQAGVKSSF